MWWMRGYYIVVRIFSAPLHQSPTKIYVALSKCPQFLLKYFIWADEWFWSVCVSIHHLQFWQWSLRPPCSSWRPGLGGQTCLRWGMPCHRKSRRPSESSSSVVGGPGCTIPAAQPEERIDNTFTHSVKWLQVSFLSLFHCFSQDAFVSAAQRKILLIKPFSGRKTKRKRRVQYVGERKTQLIRLWVLAKQCFRPCRRIQVNTT